MDLGLGGQPDDLKPSVGGRVSAPDFIPLGQAHLYPCLQSSIMLPRQGTGLTHLLGTEAAFLLHNHGACSPVPSLSGLALLCWQGEV